MTKSVKIGLGIGILGASVGAYFLIQYLVLKKRYNTSLSAPDASVLVKQKTQDVGDNIIPDEISKNADLQKGSEVQDSTIETSAENINDLEEYTPW